MYRRVLTLCLLPTLTLAVGCGKDRAEPKHRTLTGIAESINVDTGEVSMRFYREKTQQWTTVSGEVTDQTEVLINGRQAKLSEVLPGDNVEVVGKQEGEGLNKRLVALRITVTREEEFSASAPAAEPKSAPQP